MSARQKSELCCLGFLKLYTDVTPLGVHPVGNTRFASRHGTGASAPRGYGTSFLCTKYIHVYIITPQNLIFVSVIDFGLRPQADLFIQQSLTISHTHTHTHRHTHKTARLCNRQQAIECFVHLLCKYS